MVPARPASASGPGDWLDELLEGRNAVRANLPPAPVRPMRPSLAIAGRIVALVVLGLVAIGAGILVGRVSGRAWIGLIVFLILGWVLLLLAFGLVGAIRVAADDRRRRAERAREDPIASLLPSRGARRAEHLDPARYQALLDLPDRPALVVDEALFDQRSPGAIGRLAGRGRLPEPEVLEVSQFPAGTAVIGVIILINTLQFSAPMVMAIRSGAPLSGWSLLSLVAIAAAIYLIVRDPLVRRKLGLSGLLGRDAVVGAGWLLDEKGRIWTVDDSVALVTSQGTGVEVRLIGRECVHVFFLPVMLFNRAGRGAQRPNPKSTAGRARRLVGDAVVGGAEAIGIERGPAPDQEMPGPDEPLRLFLSSWSHPEPRTDLAPRREQGLRRELRSRPPSDR